MLTLESKIYFWRKIQKTGNEPYIGGVTPVPRASIPKTPFSRKCPVVSFSNLLRLKEIRETVHLPGRHRRRRQGSEDLFQHRHCGLHSKWVQNIGMCAYPPVSSIFKSQIWLCRFFLCSTKTYWNIFKFVRHHQVVKFVAKSESLLNVHICRLKVESGMFGLWQLFLNLWPKFSDYVVTGRIVVILTRFPYLTLGTELA